MSEIDETEIMAAKKRLNFQDDSAMMRRLTNPVQVYAQGRATRHGKIVRNQLAHLLGESRSSSDLTQSLLQLGPIAGTEPVDQV